MFRWKDSIQWKLIAVIVPLVTLAMGIIGITSYHRAQRELLARTEEAATASANGYSRDLETWLQSMVDSAVHMSLSPAVRSLDWNQQRAYLENVQQHFDYLHDIWVADRNGRFQTISGETGSLADQVHFQTALRGKANVNPNIITSKTSGERIVAVAAPIYDDSNRIAGVLGFSVSVEYIQSLVVDISAGANSYGFAIDGNGYVFAHPLPELRNMNVFEAGMGQGVSEALKDALAGKSGFTLYTWGDRKMYAAYAPISGTNWVLAIAIPEAVITDALAGIRNTTVLVVAASIVVLSLTIIWFVRRYVGSLSFLVQHLESMAQGEFHATVKQKTRDEVGRSFGALERLRAQLAEAIRQAAQLSHQLAVASQELSASTEETGASIEEIASTANEFAATVTAMSDNVQTMTQTAEAISSRVADGSRAVTTAVDGAARIRDTMAKLSQEIMELSQRTSNIGKIVDVIRGIADQTNLLALNAAIEAARAGEHGRGFAVVADEVRQLAEQSAQATGQIAQMIRQIQTETKDVVAAMEVGSEEAAAISQRIAESGKVLEQILEAVNGITAQIHSVATSAEQIGRGSQEIAATTEEQSASVEQMALQAQKLNEMAERLDSIVKQFRLE